MIWGRFEFDKHDKYWSVHKWFAWRPAQLKCGRWCWFQYVYRRRYAGYECIEWEYCLNKENLRRNR